MDENRDIHIVLYSNDWPCRSEAAGDFALAVPPLVPENVHLLQRLES